MKLDQMKRCVEQQYEQYLNTDVTSILSVSMGVDSAVLLELYYQLGYAVHVVHFNHHKRPEAEIEAQYVQSYCDARQITCTIIDVPDISGNFQEQARNFRYTQLERIASRYSQSAIVTAHHLDDQVETYLYRMLSGSSLVKRIGILPYEKRSEYSYFRPLSTIEKAEIYAVAKTSQIKYFEDSTNKESNYMRNRLRNQVIPMIAQVFPAYRKAIVNDIDETRQLSSYFQGQLSKFSINVKFEDKRVLIEREKFMNEHQYMKALILEYYVKNIGISFKRARYEEMCKLIAGKQGIYLLKKGVALCVSNDTFSIGEFSNEEIKNEKYFFYLKDEHSKLPKPYKMWYNDRNNGSDDMFEIHHEDLPFLVVRNTQSGDEVKLGEHRKRVSRIFIDSKLPRMKRESYPIVEDIRTGEIVWIPMMYKSYKRDETREMLQIYFTDGGFYA